MSALVHLEHRHRRVAARDAAHAAAAARARAAELDVRDAPSRCPSRRPRRRRSANGHARSRWKMLPRGSASSSSRSSGVLASRQTLAVRRAQQAVLDRLGQHGVERPQRGGERLAVRAARSRSNRRAGVCRANSVSVWAVQAGPEDARIGQRVAVDLARHRRSGTRAALRLRERRLELRVGLVDVERPGERVLGRHAPLSRRRGSRLSSMFTFSCAPSGASAAGGEPSRRSSTAGAQPAMTCSHVTEPAPVALECTDARRPSASIAVTSTPVASSAPALAAQAASSAGQRAHPADRDVPCARSRCRSRGRGSSGSGAGSPRARTAKVPISASVSAIPRSTSSANAASTASPIGRSNSASHAASSPIRRAQLVAARERLEHRREHRPRHARRPVVERLPGTERGAVAGGPLERGARALGVGRVDQQPRCRCRAPACRRRSGAGASRTAARVRPRSGAAAG